MGDPCTWCVCFAFFSFLAFSFVFLLGPSVLTLCFYFLFFLQSKIVAIEYTSTIDDFDDLVDPKTLAYHCLGPEPSIMSFVLSVVKKKVSFFRIKVDRPSFPFFSHSSFLHLTPLFFFVEMTTKFNQEFYAQIKAKKIEPLSSIG